MRFVFLVDNTKLPIKLRRHFFGIRYCRIIAVFFKSSSVLALSDCKILQ